MFLHQRANPTDYKQKQQWKINMRVIPVSLKTSGKNHVLNLLELVAFWLEVKVVCSLSSPFSLKTIQTRAGRAILTAISQACAAHQTTLLNSSEMG